MHGLQKVDAAKSARRASLHSIGQLGTYKRSKVSGEGGMDELGDCHGFSDSVSSSSTSSFSSF